MNSKKELEDLARVYHRDVKAGTRVKDLAAYVDKHTEHLDYNRRTPELKRQFTMYLSEIKKHEKASVRMLHNNDEDMAVFAGLGYILSGGAVGVTARVLASSLLIGLGATPLAIMALYGGIGYFTKSRPQNQITNDYAGRLDNIQNRTVDAEFDIPMALTSALGELPEDSKARPALEEVLEHYYPGTTKQLNGKK